MYAENFILRYPIQGLLSVLISLAKKSGVNAPLTVRRNNLTQCFITLIGSREGKLHSVWKLLRFFCSDLLSIFKHFLQLYPLICLSYLAVWISGMWYVFFCTFEAFIWTTSARAATKGKSHLDIVYLVPETAHTKKSFQTGATLKEKIELKESRCGRSKVERLWTSIHQGVTVQQIYISVQRIQQNRALIHWLFPTFPPL